MRRLLGLGIFFALVLPLGAGTFGLAQSNESEVVLRVGDTTLTLAEFEPRYTFYLTNLASQRGIPLTADIVPTLVELRPIYLDQLATEFVVLELGTRLGVTVSSDFVTEQLEAIRNQFDSEDAFQEGLTDAGIADEAFLRMLIEEAELSRQTVEMLSAAVTIRDYQVQLFYDLNQDQFTAPGEVCARHILVETLEEASIIRAQLLEGAAFEDLASASIDTGSAVRGGDLGCLPMGATVPEFDAAASSAPLNEVTEPVQTDFGYHLILVYDRTEPSSVPLAEVADAIRNELETEVLRTVIEGYRNRADVELFEALVTVTPEPASE